MTIYITGGGTGGHFFPAMSVIEALLKRGEDCCYLGATDGIESTLRKNIPCPSILTPGLKRHTLLQKIFFLPNVLISFLTLSFIFIIKRPKAVLAAGGYVSLLPCVLARLLKIPLYLMEQNKIRGRVVKQFSSYAQCVFTSLPLDLPAEANNNVCIVHTGNPLSARMIKSAQAKKTRISLKNLLVMGGSSSAEAIDLALVAIAQEGILKNMHVTHIARPENRIKLEDAYAQAGVDADVKGFCHDMIPLYMEADFVISRAGASSISELALFAIPAIFVPYPYAVDNHQYYNALYVVENGGGILCQQGKDFKHCLTKHLTSLISDTDRLQNLRDNIQALSHPHAASDIAGYISSHNNK